MISYVVTYYPSIMIMDSFYGDRTMFIINCIFIIMIFGHLLMYEGKDL